MRDFALLSATGRSQEEPDNGRPNEKAGWMTANKLLQVAEHVRRIMTPDVCGSRIQFGRCAVRQIVDCLGSLASGGPNRASSASQLGRCTVCQIVDCLGSLASGGPKEQAAPAARLPSHTGLHPTSYLRSEPDQPLGQPSR